MAPRRVSATRQYSTESSEYSNIEVGRLGAGADDSSSEHPTTSTPPTSVSEDRSLESAKDAEDASQASPDANKRRSTRGRSSVGSYNLEALAKTHVSMVTSPTRNTSGLSGRTLVNKSSRDQNVAFQDEVDKALQPDWDIPAESPKGKLPPRPTRKRSVKDRLKSGVKNATGSMRSILGKRGREAIESGKRRLGKHKDEEEASPQKIKLLKELDMGKGGVLDELDLDAIDDAPVPARPAKRVKTTGKAVLQEIAQPVMTGPLQKTSDGKKVKKWHKEGLYVGQDPGFDSTRVGPKKLKKKRPASAMFEDDEVTEPATKKKKNKLNFNLPMFSYLDKDRSFVIPYDVFAPAPHRMKEKPKDWKQLNKNRLIGEAKDLWDRSEKLAQSSCVCQFPGEGELGCDYDCLNRVMQYECNEDNCRLGAAVCSNRPFAELAERTKKGGTFDVGVEVVKTEQRGHGIRAARSFRPGQIIMEYTGEIISEEECQRRMRDDYMDKSCYYLMELERNLVIDGTKGSMARFINHSCDPNCEVRMIKANGIPRMAVFAGDSGIMTGEELTYDYNFDNFGETRQPCYCGSSNCRGYLGKRLNATELKKQQKEDEERRRKAAEEAQKAAAAAQRKKQVKNDRGAGWHGWVPVAEVKAELKERKRVLEEQEKNSTRAKRLAARNSGIPAALPHSPAKAKSPSKASSSRRRTIHAPRRVAKDADEEAEEEAEEESVVPTTAKHLRKTSTGSRFTEALDLDRRPSSRPGSKQSSRSMGKKLALSAKSSMDVQREEEDDEDEEGITVGNPLARALQGDDEAEVLAEEPTKAQAPRTATQNKRQSLLATVSGAAKIAGTKWKQTTIGFTKLS